VDLKLPFIFGRDHYGIFGQVLSFFVVVHILLDVLSGFLVWCHPVTIE